jgi:hypothetical protein
MLAQGTLRFTFESDPVGQRPSYVTLPTLPFQAVSATVIASAGGVTAYEGQRFLAISGGAVITPPVGELIQAFTAHLYVPPQPGRLGFEVGGIPGDTTELGQWQTIAGAFQTPVQSLLIEGGYILGEQFPAALYADDIELTTTPEPGSVLLFGFGGFALWVPRRIRCGA